MRITIEATTTIEHLLSSILWSSFVSINNGRVGRKIILAWNLKIVKCRDLTLTLGSRIVQKIYVIKISMPSFGKYLEYIIDFDSTFREIAP